MSTQHPHSHSRSHPEGNSTDNAGTADSLANVPLLRAEFAMNDRDWDALFDAVAQRLTESVSDLSACRSIESGAASYVPRTAFTLQKVRGQVLDCVEALAKLHAALRVKRALASELSTPKRGAITLE